jgi:colanic acid/amylovoran biosynthesis protein
MLIMSKLEKLGAILNEGIKFIDSCDMVSDESGGDSFSDIYGMERFYIINRAKQLTVNRKKTLVLLPQTYGPNKKFQARKKAAESFKNATFAWARDNDNYKILQDLLGSHFSSQQHRCGVDMAFRLQKINAGQKISESLNDWLNKSASSESCVVGLNISGLVYNVPDKAKTTYGFKADYRKLVNDLVTWFLNNKKANIVLISHVMAKPGHYEFDFEACEDIAAAVDEKYLERVTVSPQTLNESEAKWLISKLDWFCGTSMNSTIAGLSSYVATLTISYSDKAKGVFDTFEQGKHVIDPRINDTNEALYLLINSFNKMSETKSSMLQPIQKAKTSADEMMQEIASKI